MNIIGDVEGRACFIIDDIVDSAGTLCNASNALLDQGATEVYAYVTHGVLSGEAVERVNNSSLTKLVLTDTIEESDLVLKSNKIEVISISSLLGEAIKRISDEKSVSSLFD
jgi:ribose-phosphate pyrophosphokinase